MYFFINVKFEKINSINDAYNYANHVVNIITQNHLELAKDEKKFLENKNLLNEESYRKYFNNYLKNLNSEHINVLFGMGPYYAYSLDKINTIEKYINKIEKGNKAILVKYPTVPITNNNNLKSLELSYQVIGVFVLLGILLGSFFVIMRNSIINYKNSRTKSD